MDAQAELRSEWNAKYDYVREAYGPSALDLEAELEYDRQNAEAEWLDSDEGRELVSLERSL